MTGEYSASARSVTVIEKNGQLLLANRPLHHLGDLAFHPAGARNVRIRFAGDTVTIHDGTLVVTAKRIRN